MLRPRRPTASIWALTGALFGASAAVVTWAPTHPIVVGWDRWPTYVGFVVAFGLIEMLVFHVPLGAERHTISWNEVVVALGLATLPPRPLLAAQALGLGVFLGAVRRQGPTRWAFNVTQATVSVGVGAVVAHGMEDIVGGEVGAWLAVFVGACASGIVSALLVSVVLWLVGGGRLDLRRISDFSAVVVVGAASGGVVIGVTVSVSPFLVAFPLLMSSILVAGHRAYVAARLPRG